ncbi:hypothetical protein CYMTET_19332 [Cymbomonas tetramitiformis]|uniref:Uncharacterized protein n=1 Tax=Cymbomonas tetramitiformis TaxID=36881 RepID=A0AAE0L5A8_9CHLO|nr:hypothetical protein CYMTET_19332 [Cymbomonas tetramitiformis]
MLDEYRNAMASRIQAAWTGRKERARYKVALKEARQRQRVIGRRGLLDSCRRWSAKAKSALANEAASGGGKEEEELVSAGDKRRPRGPPPASAWEGEAWWRPDVDFGSGGPDDADMLQCMRRVLNYGEEHLELERWYTGAMEDDLNKAVTTDWELHQNKLAELKKKRKNGAAKLVSNQAAADKLAAALRTAQAQHESSVAKEEEEMQHLTGVIGGTLCAMQEASRIILEEKRGRELMLGRLAIAEEEQRALLKENERELQELEGKLAHKRAAIDAQLQASVDNSASAQNSYKVALELIEQQVQTVSQALRQQQRAGEEQSEEGAEAKEELARVVEQARTKLRAAVQAAGADGSVNHQEVMFKELVALLERTPCAASHIFQVQEIFQGLHEVDSEWQSSVKGETAAWKREALASLDSDESAQRQQLLYNRQTAIDRLAEMKRLVDQEQAEMDKLLSGERDALDARRRSGEEKAVAFSDWAATAADQVQAARMRIKEGQIGGEVPQDKIAHGKHEDDAEEKLQQSLQAQIDSLHSKFKSRISGREVLEEKLASLVKSMANAVRQLDETIETPLMRKARQCAEAKFWEVANEFRQTALNSGLWEGRIEREQQKVEAAVKDLWKSVERAHVRVRRQCAARAQEEEELTKQDLVQLNGGVTRRGGEKSLQLTERKAMQEAKGVRLVFDQKREARDQKGLRLALQEGVDGLLLFRDEVEGLEVARLQALHGQGERLRSMEHKSRKENDETEERLGGITQEAGMLTQEVRRVHTMRAKREKQARAEHSRVQKEIAESNAGLASKVRELEQNVADEEERLTREQAYQETLFTQRENELASAGAGAKERLKELRAERNLLRWKMESRRITIRQLATTKEEQMSRELTQQLRIKEERAGGFVAKFSEDSSTFSEWIAAMSTTLKAAVQECDSLAQTLQENRATWMDATLPKWQRALADAEVAMETGPPPETLQVEQEIIGMLKAMAAELNDPKAVSRLIQSKRPAYPASGKGRGKLPEQDGSITSMADSFSRVRKSSSLRLSTNDFESGDEMYIPNTPGKSPGRPKTPSSRSRSSMKSPGPQRMMAQSGDERDAKSGWDKLKQSVQGGKKLIARKRNRRGARPNSSDGQGLPSSPSFTGGYDDQPATASGKFGSLYRRPSSAQVKKDLEDLQELNQLQNHPRTGDTVPPVGPLPLPGPAAEDVSGRSTSGSDASATITPNITPRMSISRSSSNGSLPGARRPPSGPKKYANMLDATQSPNPELPPPITRSESLHSTRSESLHSSRCLPAPRRQARGGGGTAQVDCSGCSAAHPSGSALARRHHMLQGVNKSMARVL